MMPIVISILFLPIVRGDMGGDADQADMGDTSSTSDVEMDLDMNDPNIHNPQPKHGFGFREENPKFGPPTTAGTTLPTQPQTTKDPGTHGHQSMMAVLQFGVIVGVCLMVGAGFMSMVGLEMLCDKAVEKYREFTKKPKPLPDIERLHPAELVGTFSRYK